MKNITSIILTAAFLWVSTHANAATDKLFSAFTAVTTATNNDYLLINTNAAGGSVSYATRIITASNLLESMKGMPNWTGGGTANVQRSTWFYVDAVYGNDSTAISNSVINPWKTVDAAHNAFTNANIPGSVLEINPHPGGGYNVTNALIMPDYSTIRGNGYVKLLTWVNQTTNGSLIRPGSYSFIENIIGIAAKSNTVNYGQSFVGVFGYATGGGNNRAFTNAYMRNCQWIGDYDGIILAHSNRCSLFVESSLFNAKADCILVGSAINGNTNTFLSFDNCLLINTNASEVSVGYNPIGASILGGIVRMKDSYLDVRAPIGTTAIGIKVAPVLADGGAQLELINTTIIVRNSNGVNSAVQIANSADLSLDPTITNVLVRSPNNIERSRVTGPVEWGRGAIGLTDIVVPTGKDFFVTSWGDGINILQTNLFYVHRSKRELVVTNLTFVNSSGTRLAGVTNTGSFDQNGVATFNDDVALPLISASKILRTDGSSIIGEVTIGPNLSFDGTTLSATGGGSGGTNYPPVIRIGTNVTVASGVRQSLTLQTNASFALVFTGTPLNGEEIQLGVSNIASSTIYLTNTAGIYDYSVASNVTTFPISGTSVRWFTFVNSTNFNLGVARWELRSSFGKEAEIAVAGSNGVPFLVLSTNAAGSIITVSNTYVPHPTNLALANISGLASTVFTNVPLGGTNISVRTTGGTNFIDTTGQLNNWANFTTNVWNSRQGGSAVLTNLAGVYQTFTNVFTRTATTVSGAGSGSTNYLLTLSTNSLNDFHLGSSNVHIYTVGGGTLTQPIYWNAYVTNLSENTWGINFSSGTNRWRFSGVYGTNAPIVLTNGTLLQLSGRSDGTNTIVGYTYYAPGL